MQKRRIRTINLDKDVISLKTGGLCSGSPGGVRSPVIIDVDVWIARRDIAEPGQDVRTDKVIRMGVKWMGAGGDLVPASLEALKAIENYIRTWWRS